MTKNKKPKTPWPNIEVTERTQIYLAGFHEGYKYATAVADEKKPKAKKRARAAK